MECAASESRAGGGGGVGKNVKMRLCLRAIRLLVAVASIGGEDATAATGGGRGVLSPDGSNGNEEADRSEAQPHFDVLPDAATAACTAFAGGALHQSHS